jgi:adenosylhomocysteinase
MPLHARIRERFEREQPFAGHRIGAALHLEAKTANLILTLHAGGANLYVIGSNPLSTQDEIVAALSEVNGITVAACHGETLEEHEKRIDQLLRFSPTLIVEDGGDVAVRLHEHSPEVAMQLVGVCEETTTGVERLQELEQQGKLSVPAIAVNNAKMKHLFDNRYGTGQSTWDAIMRATNLLVAGRTVLIVGYGWCGKGLALRARGLGARVLVAEIDPVKAVEAAMEGHEVITLAEGIERADFVVTSTGCAGVIDEGMLRRSKDGVLLANAGHFGYEIDREALERLAKEHHQARDGVEAYLFPDGRTIYLLGEGELVNLALADGHPVEIMDISFALQSLSLEYLALRRRGLSARVHPVPPETDEEVARMVLATLGSS